MASDTCPLPELGASGGAVASSNAPAKKEPMSPRRLPVSHSPYSTRFSAAGRGPVLNPENHVQSARSVLTRNSWTVAFDEPKSRMKIPANFASDVGRKHFGFSHEELDNAAAYYEGQFKISMRHGHGVMHNPETGAKYEGQFQADRFHGEGDQTWPDGSRYTGQWVRGQKHGTGSYTSASSLRYAGQWEHGRRHGSGTQEYANGDEYKGWWINGLCNGIGTYYYADGSVFEGIWSNGRHDGVGTMFGSDGTRERQTYATGLLMRREVLPNGSVPKRGALTWNCVGSKALFDQARDDMLKPTQLAKPRLSKFLIRRETAGVDLSAPPLRPRTVPAGRSRGLGPLEAEATKPGTAPALLGGGRLASARGPDAPGEGL